MLYWKVPMGPFLPKWTDRFLPILLLIQLSPGPFFPDRFYPDRFYLDRSYPDRSYLDPRLCVASRRTFSQHRAPASCWQSANMPVSVSTLNYAATTTKWLFGGWRSEYTPAIRYAVRHPGDEVSGNHADEHCVCVCLCVYVWFQLRVLLPVHHQVRPRQSLLSSHWISSTIRPPHSHLSIRSSLNVPYLVVTFCPVSQLNILVV